MIQSYFINGPPSRTHTPLSGWDYVTRGEHASVLRMIFNPIGCLFLFLFFLLHLHRLSAVLCCSLGALEGRTAGVSSQVARSSLRTSLRLRQLARGTVPSGSPKASKQQHEKATFNYWVKRFVEILCLALCLFSLPLSHSFPPLFPSVASNSSHMFRHCLACGEVHFSNGSFAQIPLLHCLVFADTREERCVYFFFLVGFILFILVLIIFLSLFASLASLWDFAKVLGALVHFFLFYFAFLPPSLPFSFISRH